jgi:hypothetical protein
MPPPLRGGQPLKDIFFGDYIFCIPDYQRDFVWTVHEADHLLHDIHGAFKRSVTSGDAAACYLGAIVLNEKPTQAVVDDGFPDFATRPVRTSGPELGPRADVVDGQQRLITLTILFASLRDLIDDLRYVEELHRLIAVKRRTTPPATNSGEEIYLLEIGSEAGDILNRSVQPLGATRKPLLSEHTADLPARRLLDVKAAIARHVQSMTMPERRALADFLRDRCYLSVAITSEAESDWQLFSRMNARGRPISRSDTLKAELLGSIEPADREALVTLWNERKSALGVEFDGEARRRYLFSYISDIAGRGSGDIVERISNAARERGAVAFMREVFDPLSRAYLDVTALAYDGGDQHTRYRINHLLGCIPLAEVALDHRERQHGTSIITILLRWLTANRHDPDATLRFLTLLDNYVYACLIIHSSNMPLFAQRIAVIEQALRAAPRMALDALALPMSRLATTRKLGRHLDGLAARIVLARLHAEIDPGGLAAAKRATMPDFDIEHVLPRNPTAWAHWPRSHPIREHIDSLGNIFVVPIRLNRLLGNKSWQQKRALIAANADAIILPLGDRLRTATDWTPQLIRERQEQLTKVAQLTWTFGAGHPPRQSLKAKMPRPKSAGRRRRKTP